MPLEIKTCEQCGKQYPLHTSRGHAGRFCSWECHINSAPRRHLVVCPVCSITFKQKEIGQKFCCRECYRNRLLPKHSTKETLVTCDYCGKKFYKWTYRISPNKGNYCNRECASHLTQCPGQWTQRICEICGEKFTIQTWFLTHRENTGRYCSNACQSQAFSERRRGPNNPMWKGGHDPYRGPNWHSQKKLARKRDNQTCQACNRKPSMRYLDVHHIQPFRTFNYVKDENTNYLQANHLSNLITLCRKCHKHAEYGNIDVWHMVKGTFRYPKSPLLPIPSRGQNG